MNREKIQLEIKKNRLWADIKDNIKEIYYLFCDPNSLPDNDLKALWKRAYISSLCINLVFIELTLSHDNYEEVENTNFLSQIVGEQKLKSEFVKTCFSIVTSKENSIDEKQMVIDELRASAWREILPYTKDIAYLATDFTAENLIMNIIKNPDVLTKCIDIVLLELKLNEIEVEMLEQIKWD